jgi:hypothetical protein
MTDPDGTVIRLYSLQQHGIDRTGVPGYARPAIDTSITPPPAS